LNKANVIQLCT